MKRRALPQQVATPKVVRCAIYTRKSTEEGLQQDFNTLDAQRESGENYIASQKAEGWVCLPDRYDDGGYTGGNLDRPAMQRLLTDIDAGKVDCVVVYKVDRLSRSLLDFSRIMETFEGHKVSFVSVTQHFNTTHSMGRLTLNILLSFAQFEREIISERTRDKIAAARRKGKWSGGKPLLGYDMLALPGGTKLVVNQVEAQQVRSMFELYLENEALIPTIKALDERGWHTKRWVTRKGETRGGKPFNKNSLFKLLTNVTYLGKVTYRDEVHPGEQPPIVDEDIWKRVQTILNRNGRSGGAPVKNKHGALLRGLLRCVPCNCSMTHGFSQKGPNKRYRYYICLNAMKRGWQFCPSKSVPAGEIENLVVERIKFIGREPGVLAETIRQAQEQGKGELAELENRRRHLARELARQNAEVRRLAASANCSTDAGSLARLRERIVTLEQRATEVNESMIAASRQRVDQREVEAALSMFDPVWRTLAPREQARIIRLLVERVDYDGKRGKVAITFRPTGIRELAQERKEVAV